MNGLCRGHRQSDKSTSVHSQSIACASFQRQLLSCTDTCPGFTAPVPHSQPPGVAPAVRSSSSAPSAFSALRYLRPLHHCPFRGHQAGTPSAPHGASSRSTQYPVPLDASESSSRPSSPAAPGPESSHRAPPPRARGTRRSPLSKPAPHRDPSAVCGGRRMYPSPTRPSRGGRRRCCASGGGRKKSVSLAHPIVGVAESLAGVRRPRVMETARMGWRTSLRVTLRPTGAWRDTLPSCLLACGLWSAATKHY